MNDKRIDLMKNEKVSKAINKMAAPAIIGMMVMAVYNVVDSIFVSWISEGGYEVAATQVVLPIMLIASAIGLALGMGGGSYISRLLGKNNKIEANKVASVSFFTGIVLGLIITTINIILLEPILNLFGADINTLELAKQYGSYIVVGYAFTILNMIMNNLLRSEGSAKYSMIGMAAGSILNLILDPIFIFVFGWGIAGAAIATTLSQIVSTIILLSFYFRKKSIIKINLKYFKPSVSIYTEILKVGVPTFFRQMLVSISIGILNNAASDISTDLITAIGIITRVTMIPMYIVFGFGQGFQPVAGYNYGSGNKQRVIDSFKYAVTISVIIMSVSCVIFLLFGNIVFDIYNASESVTNYGIIGLKYYAIGLLFMGISNTIAVFYQALGRGVEALILSVARQGIFFIPLILILPGILGVHGVLASQAIADLFTVILSIAVIAPFILNDKLDVLMTH
jgi:putative MATE family efflux protein